MKTIVVSAVNLNVGGTLTILNDCLKYLSESNKCNQYRIVAIVFDKKLCEFPNIEYIETKWPKKRWVNRLWYEYVSMKKISKSLAPIELWFSLHDTTPNVIAKKQVVYCHNPFPFYKWKWQEVFVAPKIVLFALFSKFIYQKGIKKNDYVIVQQDWIRQKFKKLFQLPENKIIIAQPDPPKSIEVSLKNVKNSSFGFVYAASPNSHKNFEALLEAVKILNAQGVSNFHVTITVDGSENAYAKWIYNKYKDLLEIRFKGFMDREALFLCYAESNCLVFPSKIETWGLPISEFKKFDKPMLLADLPYAHETSAGAGQVAFFSPDEPEQLAKQMRLLIEGDLSRLQPVPKLQLRAPLVDSWDGLFSIILK